MTNARTRIGFSLSLASIVLFLLSLPILDVFTHPFSVLYGKDYTPLVIRLSDIYWLWHSGVIIRVSLFGLPLLLIAVIWFMDIQGFSFSRALTVVLLPFLAALVIQYFIAVQLDKYLRFPSMGHEVPWEHVFQLPFILHCSSVALVYAAIVTTLIAGTRHIRKGWIPRRLAD